VKYFKATATVKTASNSEAEFEVGLFLAQDHEHAHMRAYNLHFLPNMLPIIDSLLHKRDDKVVSVIMHTFIN